MEFEHDEQTLEPIDPPALDELAVELDDQRPVLEAALEQERAANQALLARVRGVLLASEPAISPGLVSGDTLAEIEASFAAARETVERARASAAAPPPAIGAGAPGRLPAPRATPFEKIRQGLSRR